MSAERTERLLNLLTLLLNTRRPISLREIREHPEFSAYLTHDPKSGERAFERDKAALTELGVPVRWVAPEGEEDEDGLGGYIVDQKRYYMPDLALAPAEVALLSIAGAAAAAIEGFPGRPTVIRALAKIGFDVDDAHPGPTLAHAPIKSAKNAQLAALHLQTLHDAVAARRQIRLAYDSLRGEGTQRQVDPYGLYYRQGVWYLVGYCHLRQAERTFHLGRIREVKLTHADRRTPDFTVPEGFDISTHVERRPWEFPQHASIDVTIRLARRLLPAIPEIFGRRADVVEMTGGAEVRVRVSHRQALIAAVLPYGAAAEVLEPADLRQEIAQIYEQLSRRYQKRPRSLRQAKSSAPRQRPSTRRAARAGSRGSRA
ncbi:MAG: WYL domain-containing protein [Deltaproteobacteria bacterium]|nr:WYL domain-containing protein [Deltaproteobacteria bacterium]